MNIPLKAVLFSMFAVVSITIASVVTAPTSYATDTESAQAAQSIALEIVPICSDTASAQAYWKVTNKNTDNVDIHWNNVVNTKEGDFVAEPGTTSGKLVTYYNSADPNNRTEFTYQNQTSATNAKAEQCQPVVDTPAPCVDAHNPANLIWTPNVPNSVASNRSIITINTKNGAPACEDTTIFLSSYLMRDDYNGKGFGDPTSYPQTKFDAQSVTFAAGAAQAYTLDIAVPSACKNYQLDLYYAPEIVTVDQSGHGSQVFDSTIHNSEGACQTTPPACTSDCNPGQGGGETPTTPTIPAAPKTPVTPTVSGSVESAATEQLPTELPATGSNGPLGFLSAFILLGLTYVTLYTLLPRKPNV